VSFGVVVAAIAAVVHVVLNGPDQPPTFQKQSSRATPKPRRRKEPKSPAPATEVVATVVPPRPALGLPVTAAFAGPDSDLMRLRVLPARHNSVWVRVRSGIVLVILVAVLGALLALAIGGVMLGLALLVRSATG
jgi:hypothetical protein